MPFSVLDLSLVPPALAGAAMVLGVLISSALYTLRS